MSSTRSIAPVLAGLSIGLGACHRESGIGDKPIEAADATPTVARAPAPQVRVRDACTLITKAEADAILGSPVTLEPRDADAGESMCYYDAGSEPGFGLKVTWADGRQALELTKKTQPLAGAMIKQDKLDATIVASLTALEPVEGLGDEAYFNLRESYARKGHVLLDFMLQELTQSHIATGHMDAPKGLKEKWAALARAAIARL